MSSRAPLRAAVAGSTGYIGMQCVALLTAHPEVEIVTLLGRSGAGQRHADLVPGSDCQLTVSAGLDPGDVDVVFAALPHTVAAGQAAAWLDAGCVVVDMSADFRIADAAVYERWYGVPHPCPELATEAAYGLVELERDAVRAARLIASPGCYPTAALLGALPALRAGLVEPEIIVDAKSGVSGAGRSPSLTTHFAEADEAVTAYSVSGHRHGAEMRSRLQPASSSALRLTFVPHLTPMTRGLLATLYLRPVVGRAVADVAAALRALCAEEPFLRYVDRPPSTKSVIHSNMAAINCTDQEGTAVVTVAIDNLIKGAAGQGVQAMNAHFGLAETAGLARTSPWP